MSALPARAWHGLVLILFVLKEMVVNSAHLVVTLIRPGIRFRPFLIEVPLRCPGDRSTAVLGVLIALSSPQQYGIEVSTDPRRITVYVLDAPDEESAREDVRRLETLLLRVIGSPARPGDPPEVRS